MAAKICDICGAPLGMFQKHKAADGAVCHKCFTAAGYSTGMVCFADTVDTLKAKMMVSGQIPPPRSKREVLFQAVSTAAPAHPNSRSGLSNAHLPTGKREAEMMAAQWVKQAADSVKLINTTKKPSTFFERYDFFLDTLERLSYCEKWVHFQGTPPSIALRNAIAEQDEQMRLFILRYAQDTREKMYQLSTQKGKLNKAEAYYNTLTEYSARISNENVLLFTEQYELLKGIA